MRNPCLWGCLAWLVFGLAVDANAQSPVKRGTLDDARALVAERLKRFDRNGDGKLSKDELPARMADRMLQRADTNGDGMIDADELKRMATRSRREVRPQLLKLGQRTPDFNLPLLEPMDDAEGKLTYRVTDDTVRLSSLRGRKVVCVFLTSYT